MGRVKIGRTMEDLQIRWTQKTPSVECRSEDGYIRIEGQSIPENAQEFYERLNAWVETYSKEIGGPLEVVISLDYYNSATSKCILTFFDILSGLWLHGRKVSVVWMYAEEDDDMREEGESYQKVVNFPIRLEAYAGERE